MDVVVPVHGKWTLTESCLRHLMRQTIEHNVILVDDRSPDDTVVRVRADFPDVTVIEMERNRGFGAACNRGIRHGTAPIVVVLNNDVDSDPELLAELVRPFTDRSVGSAAALLRRPDGRIDSIGILADATMAGFTRGHGAPLVVSATLPTLLGPCGAAAAFRRAALDEVGLFDERIHMYGEDLDLNLRLRAAGWDSVAVENAQGIHLGGGTSGQGSAKQRYNAGFGRGYLLRSYGVLTSRYAIRAAATEALVCGASVLLQRDAADLRGRLAGWQAARSVPKHSRPSVGIEESIGFVRSLRMRWDGHRSTPAVRSGGGR